jgi:hypothetical protein
MDALNRFTRFVSRFVPRASILVETSAERCAAPNALSVGQQRSNIMVTVFHRPLGRGHPGLVDELAVRTAREQ